MAQLRQDHETFEAAGTKIVCIAQGTTDDRDAFLEAHGPYPFPIYADPNRDAYVAYGLARGSLAQVIFNPAVIMAGVEAFQEGHRVEAIVGDPFQLSGTFVVGTDGIVQFAYPGKLSSDFPSNTTVLDALSR